MSHLLVIDDSPFDCRLVGALLERWKKYQVEYASNGVEALEQMEDRLPLAVISDIQMPEMDGMQLVQAVRQRYPSVPVILMTAHGSEQIALEALMLGASDYIPKSRLGSDLQESVEGVLAIAVGDRPHQRLSHCLRHQEFRYALDSDVLLIPPLVQRMQHAALEVGLVDEVESMRLGKALLEALQNAICHGSSPAPSPTEDAQPAGPSVHVQASFTPQEARFVIRDEGPGFDTSRLPDVHKDPSYLSGSGGRGLVLIGMFMDEVRFNPSGNEITMVKRRQVSPAVSGSPESPELAK